MTMPINLVLVRHGESEGNVANRASRAGDDRHFTDAFRERHNSTFRLTDRGREQALSAGDWIRRNLIPHMRFDRFYVSEYLRAIETAGLLGIPEASWMLDFNLRERDWGSLDNMPDGERHERFAEEMARRDRDAFYWAPAGGESMANLSLRNGRTLHTLHRECSDMNVIVVCHGEVTWSFRVGIERLTQREYMELDRSKDPRDRIHNCQIIHYTRRDPKTQKMSKYMGWMRSVCPTDLKLSRNEWVPITRKTFSNEELLRLAEEQERMVSS